MDLLKNCCKSISDQCRRGCLGYCVNPNGCDYCFNRNLILLEDFEYFFNNFDKETYEEDKDIKKLFTNPLYTSAEGALAATSLPGNIEPIKLVKENRKRKLSSDSKSNKRRCKEHNKFYSKCRICNPKCICEHGNIKYTCKEGCLCVHKRLKDKCDICIKNRNLKEICKEDK